MRSLGDFAKATILGGFVFLAPVVLAVLLVRHAFRLTAEALRPIAPWIPPGRVAGVVLLDVVAALALLVVCFLTGLLVGTRLGRAIRARLEGAILGRMPGYVFLKSLAGRSAEGDEHPPVSVVLARFDDASVLAFLMERHDDGLCTLFVPGAPTPTSGSVYYMTEDRVRPLDVPVLAAMGCMMRLGLGSRDLIRRAAISPSPPPSAPGREPAR